MLDAGKLMLWRLLPVLLVTVASGLWFNDVQDSGPYVARNLIPLVMLVLLAVFVLYRGRGQWTGVGKRLPMGVVAFAIPALGLELYLHYAYAVNLNGMFTDAPHPERIFQYLPIYTSVAGGIGFAIGWIGGRNL